MWAQQQTLELLCLVTIFCHKGLWYRGLWLGKKCIYMACPKCIQPCNTKYIDIYWRRYKIQEALHLGQYLSPLQSRHLETTHSSPNRHQLPRCIFLILSHGMKSLPFQRWLVWGKARSHRAPNLGCRRAESPGWFDVSPKNSAWDMMHEWAGALSWWSCQSPVAHNCGLLYHPNSLCGGMFKLNAKFDADL